MTRPCARQTCARQIRSVPLDQAAPNGPEAREHGESGQDAEAVVVRLYRENGAFVLG